MTVIKPYCSLSQLKKIIRKARLRLLELHHNAHAGHIGGNLSCLDSLVVLYDAVLSEDDAFVLSKGHSAGALYVALWSCGVLTDEDLQTFAQDGTRLGVHTPANLIPSVLFGTGSLGHGPSLAAGLALGKRLQGIPGRVFCLCSDGEWQEGSCWESLIFAVHQKLSNLHLVLDVNGLQAFGTTVEVASLDLESLAGRLTAFGAAVATCDGHDLLALVEHLNCPEDGQRPSVLLLRTCKGKGLPFLENSLASHYWPLTDEQYFQGRAIIEDDDA
jgi:transketolase